MLSKQLLVDIQYFDGNRKFFKNYIKLYRNLKFITCISMLV